MCKIKTIQCCCCWVRRDQQPGSIQTLKIFSVLMKIQNLDKVVYHSTSRILKLQMILGCMCRNWINRQWNFRIRLQLDAFRKNNLMIIVVVLLKSCSRMKNWIGLRVWNSWNKGRVGAQKLNNCRLNKCVRIQSSVLRNFCKNCEFYKTIFN